MGLSQGDPKQGFGPKLSHFWAGNRPILRALLEPVLSSLGERNAGFRLGGPSERASF